MAKKRKTKKKANKRLGLILALLVVLLGIVGIILFLTINVAELYINAKAVEDSGIKGVALAFGYKGAIEAIGIRAEIEILKFSFLNLLPLILMALGIILALPKSRIINIIGSLLLIGASVLVLFAGSFVVYSEGFNDAIELFKNINSGIGGLFGSTEAVFVGYKATVGAYIIMGLGSLSGLIALVKGLLKK